MTIRTITLATLLMAAATLAAGPALAQAMAGNAGPAEIPASRDAPLTLPGTLAPMPTPKLDDATPRDIFGLDPARVLDSLGTITLDRGGDVFETPASAAQRAIFEARTGGSRGE